MRRLVYLFAAAAFVAPLGLHGQESTATTAEQVLGTILGAINLPQIAQEARDAGVADSTLTTVLDEMRDREVPAGEAEDILEQEVEAVRAGGPVDNFGAFVQSQLAAGLRGRDLAQAIRAEHRARGIGIPEGRPERMRGPGMRGNGNEMRGGPPEGRGRPDGAGRANEGRPGQNGRRGPGGTR